MLQDWTYRFDGRSGIRNSNPSSIVDLTQRLSLAGTTSGGGSVPTVVDNAFSLGLIPKKQVGISFEPTTTTSSTNGELTFGGTDTSKFTGPLTTVSVPPTYLNTYHCSFVIIDRLPRHPRLTSSWGSIKPSAMELPSFYRRRPALSILVPLCSC